MRVTKKQLKLIIENYLLEQDAMPEDEEFEEEDAAPEEEDVADEEQEEGEGDATPEEEDVADEEPEEDPEEEFQEFETDEYPVVFGDKKVFAKVIGPGIDGVKVYKDTGDRIEGLKPLEISAIMFKTLVQIIQKGGDKEDKKNLINFFKNSQPKLKTLSDEDVEKDIASKERIWKMSLSKLKDKLNRENYIK